MGDIAISNGVRANLSALQSTAKLMETTQNRLSTGNRVNSALDNPANYFTASAMSNRASDLGGLLDSMKTGINTIKAADAALTSITKLVESAQGSARQALQDATSELPTTIESAGVIDTSGTTVAGAVTAKQQALGQKLSDMGFDTNDSFTITTAKDGVTNEFAYTPAADDTVEDMVDAINASGVAVAEVTDAGKLKLTSGDGEDLTLAMAAEDGVDATTQSASLFAKLGFGAQASYEEDSDTNYNEAGETKVTYADGAAAGDNDTLTIEAKANGLTDAQNETRTKLAAQFNNILDQISDLASDAEFNGINLLKGDELKVTFNEKTGDKQNSLTIEGVTFDANGLGLTKATSDFQEDDEVEVRLTQLTDALGKLRTQASEFGSNLTTVQTRQDFTNSMINVLEQGASDLTLADTNKEGANMLALQTRQQLATTTMGMASQADQSVLSFLR